MKDNFYCIKNQNYKCTHSSSPQIYSKEYTLQILSHMNKMMYVQSYSFQHCLYKRCPTYNGLTYNFLTLQQWKNDMYSVETVLWILVISQASHLTMLDSGSMTKLPVSRAATRVKTDTLTTIPYPYNYSVFHFQYSIQ